MGDGGLRAAMIWRHIAVWSVHSAKWQCNVFIVNIRVTKCLFYRWTLQYDPITVSQDVLYQLSSETAPYVAVHETW